MNLWLRYPLDMAVAFLLALGDEAPRTKREMAHVLRIGPLAFAVIWQEKVEAPR